MKSVAGYEGRYSVTRCGMVWSHVSGIWLRQGLVKRGKGYLHVQLWRDGTYENRYVHQLVAEAFVPNPNSLPTVNHEDGNTFNNRSGNLTWATHQEQQDHAWAAGLTNNCGENCGTSKLTVEEVATIVELVKTMTQREVAAMYGISQPQVSKIVNKVQWKERHASRSRRRLEAG